MTTITKSRQTIYIRDHDSLDPFGWAGACSALGGISAPVGDIEWRELYDLAALFQGAPAIEVEEGPGLVETALSIKKSVQNALIVDWLRCRWDVDVRYQECGRRDNSLNWVGVTRLCNAKFLEYGGDDEVVQSAGDDGDLILTSPVKAPWPLVHLWRIAGHIIGPDATEDFMNVAVCEHSQCDYGCVLYVGTSGFYGSPQVYYSIDEAASWTIDTLSNWDGDIDDIDCLGDFVVVVSAYDEAVMWNDLPATDAGFPLNWVEVGLAGRPLGVCIYDPGCIVVVGEDGRIWRSLDTARSFTLVDDGAATVEHLYDVVAVNSQVWWAIGDNNAIVRSVDGAATWAVVTGPVLQAGVDVTAILALDEYRILLGYADGELWYSDDQGETWARDESISGFAQISHFATCGCGRVVMVGHDASENGLAYENIDSGAPGQWQQLTVPVMGAIADVVCCDANTFIGVGSGVYLAGTIGQILKLE